MLPIHCVSACKALVAHILALMIDASSCCDAALVHMGCLFFALPSFPLPLLCSGFSFLPLVPLLLGLSFSSSLLPPPPRFLPSCPLCLLFALPSCFFFFLSSSSFPSLLPLLFLFALGVFELSSYVAVLIACRSPRRSWHRCTIREVMTLNAKHLSARLKPFSGIADC